MSDGVETMPGGGEATDQVAETLADDDSGPGGVSVVIPTFNEAENVCRAVSRCFTALEGHPAEVIVVDDDSPDRTTERARERFGDDGRVQVVRRTGERGLTQSVVDGFRRATHDRVAVIDADLQHPPEKLPELLAAMDDGAALAIGSRYTVGGEVESWSPWNRLVSRGATLLARLALPSVRSVNDPLSGFFVVHRDAVDPETIDVGGYKILLEILTKGDWAPGSVVEVPYVFSDRERGESSRTLGEYAEFVRRLRRLRRHTTMSETRSRTPVAESRRDTPTPDEDRTDRPALVSAYPPENDGLAHYAEDLVDGYVEAAGGVTVVGSTVGAEGDEEVTDGPVDVRRDWQKGRLRGLYDILHGLWAATHQYEFAHFNIKPTYFGAGNAHRFFSLFLPLAARTVCRTPTVVTLHDLVEDVDGDEVDEKIGPLQRVGATIATQAVLLAGPVTVTTERYQRLLEQKYPLGDVHHVPHGVRENGTPSPVQTTPFRVLLFGYISPYKDYETVFAAFDELRADRGDAQLWIVGEAHPDHPEHAERIRAEAVDRPGVKFFGYVEDELLPTIFEQVSVLVIPYRTAPGVSGPYQQAKAHGLPAIVYDDEDVLAATVGTGGTASVVPPGDADAMRATFDRFIENPDRLTEMAETNAEAAETTMTEVAREITHIATGETDE